MPQRMSRSVRLPSGTTVAAGLGALAVVWIALSLPPMFNAVLIAGALVGLFDYYWNERSRNRAGSPAETFSLRDRKLEISWGPDMSRIAPAGGIGFVFMVLVVFLFLTTLSRELGGIFFAVMVGVYVASGVWHVVHALWVDRSRHGTPEK